MTDLAVLHCRQLVTLAGPPGARSGPAMRSLAIIADGALHVCDGRIAAVGPRAEIERSFSADTEIVDAGGEQRIGGGLAGEADGGSDAPAGCRDLGVGGAFHAAFKLAGAVAGEHRMRVCVDEAGEYDAAAGVDDFGVRGEGTLDLRARAHGGDASVAYVQSAIGDDGERAHGGSRARAGRAREGDELAAV